MIAHAAWWLNGHSYGTLALSAFCTSRPRADFTSLAKYGQRTRIFDDQMVPPKLASFWRRPGPGFLHPGTNPKSYCVERWRELLAATWETHLFTAVLAERLNRAEPSPSDRALFPLVAPTFRAVTCAISLKTQSLKNLFPRAGSSSTGRPGES